MNNREINFEIIKHIGVLSEKTSGWRTELNIVKWGHTMLNMILDYGGIIMKRQERELH